MNLNFYLLEQYLIEFPINAHLKMRLPILININCWHNFILIRANIGMLFPLFSITYIIAPHSRIGQTMRKPFIKFICHSASYFTFLCKFFFSFYISHFVFVLFYFLFHLISREWRQFFLSISTMSAEKKIQSIVVRVEHGDDKQNDNNININTTQMENERIGDHSLIAFSNYTHFSNIWSYCECVPIHCQNIFEKKTPA